MQTYNVVFVKISTSYMSKLAAGDACTTTYMANELKNDNPRLTSDPSPSGIELNDV